MQLTSETAQPISTPACGGMQYELSESMPHRAKLSRDLPVGARVQTDYSGRITEHEIRERDTWKPSKSGILFRVYPPVPNSSGSWMDAGWFVPVEEA